MEGLILFDSDVRPFQLYAVPSCGFASSSRLFIWPFRFHHDPRGHSIPFLNLSFVYEHHETFIHTSLFPTLARVHNFLPVQTALCIVTIVVCTFLLVYARSCMMFSTI